MKGLKARKIIAQGKRSAALGNEQQMNKPCRGETTDVTPTEQRLRRNAGCLTRRSARDEQLARASTGSGGCGHTDAGE